MNFFDWFLAISHLLEINLIEKCTRIEFESPSRCALSLIFWSSLRWFILVRSQPASTSSVQLLQLKMMMMIDGSIKRWLKFCPSISISLITRSLLLDSLPWYLDGRTCWWWEPKWRRSMAASAQQPPERDNANLFSETGDSLRAHSLRFS